MVRRIVPHPAELSSDHPYWLVELTLSGLVDQLIRLTSGTTYERLSRHEVATEVLGWDPGTLSHLFESLAKANTHEAEARSASRRTAEDAKPLELDKGLSDKLRHLETHLHVFGAENYPVGLPDDARRVLLTEYWARLFSEPQRAQVRVPAGWFKDIAAMLAHAVERPVSPVMVIAAGHALLANIELQDNDATAARKRKADPLTQPAAIADREELVRNLSVGRSLVDDTVTALIEVAQLPLSLFGNEAVQVLARLRLPSAIAQVVKQIKESGTGYRLWRAVTTAYKAERYLLVRLPPQVRRPYLQRSSMLRYLDHALLGLLLDPTQVDAYPARSLTVEAIDERLRFLRTQEDLGLVDQATLRREHGVDAEALRKRTLDPEVVQAVCVSALEAIIVSELRPERERAYAAQVLAEHEEHNDREPADRLLALRLGGQLREDGLLHAALQRLGATGDRRGPAASEMLEDSQIELARWVRQAVRDLARRRDVHVPETLLRKRSTATAEYETAWDWVSGSALEAAIFTVVSSHDGVWRRQVADALHTGMLSNLVTPILAALLDDDLEVDGIRFTPLPWMRELAILAVSFQSSVDESVLDALKRVARLGAEVADDADPHTDEAHAALWALADLALHGAATTTEENPKKTAWLESIRRLFLDLAEVARAPSIQRAVAYGLVCTERLAAGDIGLKDPGRKEVTQAMEKMLESATDATVKAMLNEGSRPPVRRALGDVVTSSV